MAQLVKNPPAVPETWVLSLGWEDPLKKGKASVFWPGEFHGLYSLWGRKEVGRTEQLSLLLSIHLGIFLKSLIFTLSKIRSLCRVLNREVAKFELHFDRVTVLRKMCII